jgi:hypothetical protein
MYTETITPTHTVKARKKHYCSYCGGEIAIGEVYKSSTLKGDYLYAWKEHLRCSEIVDKLNMHDRALDWGLTASDFQEDITEHYLDLVGRRNEFYGLPTHKQPSLKDQLDFVCNHYLTPNEG